MSWKNKLRRIRWSWVEIDAEIYMIWWLKYKRNDKEETNKRWAVMKLEFGFGEIKTLLALSRNRKRSLLVYSY